MAVELGGTPFYDPPQNWNSENVIPLDTPIEDAEEEEDVSSEESELEEEIQSEESEENELVRVDSIFFDESEQDEPISPEESGREKGLNILELQKQLNKGGLSSKKRKEICDEIVAIFESVNNKKDKSYSYEEMYILRHTVEEASANGTSMLYKLVYEDLDDESCKKAIIAINENAKKAPKEAMHFHYMIYLDIDNAPSPSLKDKSVKVVIYPGSLELFDQLSRSNPHPDNPQPEDTRSPVSLTFLSVRPTALKDRWNKGLKKELPEGTKFFGLYETTPTVLSEGRVYALRKLLKGMETVARLSELISLADSLKSIRLDNNLIFINCALEKMQNINRDLLIRPESRPIFFGESGEGNLLFMLIKNLNTLESLKEREFEDIITLAKELIDDDDRLPKEYYERHQNENDSINYCNDPLRCAFVRKFESLDLEYLAKSNPEEIRDLLYKANISSFSNYVDVAVECVEKGLITSEAALKAIHEAEIWLEGNSYESKAESADQFSQRKRNLSASIDKFYELHPHLKQNDYLGSGVMIVNGAVVKIEGSYLQTRLRMIADESTFEVKNFDPLKLSEITNIEKERLLIGLTNVTSHDVEMLFKTLKVANNQEALDLLFGKNSAKANQLKEEINEKRYEELTTKEIDDLVKLLQPIEVLVDGTTRRYIGKPVQEQIESKQIETQTRGILHKFTIKYDRVKSYKALAQIEEIERPPHKDPALFRREQLAKAVAYRDGLAVGDLIKAPGSSPPLYYRIAEKFAAGEGMVAYALLPFGRPHEPDEMNECSNDRLLPMMLFRGTRSSADGFDVWGTILTDLDKKLGSSGFDSDRVKMADFLSKTPEFQEEDIEVTGHSLGGTHAQRFVCEMLKEEPFGNKNLRLDKENSALRKIHLSTYNSPGLDIEANAEAIKCLCRFNAPCVSIDAYRTQNDGIDKLGDHHLGYRERNEDVPGLNVEGSKLRIFKVEPEGRFHRIAGISSWSKENAIDLHRSTFEDKDDRDNGFSEMQIKFSEERGNERLNNGRKKRIKKAGANINRSERVNKAIYLFKERIGRRGFGTHLIRRIVKTIKKKSSSQHPDILTPRRKIDPTDPTE